MVGTSLIRPKKRLGQHFLVSESYARRIAESVPAGSDENVLEIGGGTGLLSVHLHRRFPSFHCVEKDPDLVPSLTERLGPGQYTVHNEDIIDFDFWRVGFPLHVVGNLPYSVAAMILKKVLLYGERILSLTVMVQREVGGRICAKPHTKRNGFLTMFCQFFGRPKILFHVPAGAFRPRPKVDSCVVQLTVERHLHEKLPEARWEEFFELVSRGFGQRRKKLVNALRGSYPEDTDLVHLLDEQGLDVMSRAEDLGAEQWLMLYRGAFRC